MMIFSFLVVAALCNLTTSAQAENVAGFEACQYTIPPQPNAQPHDIPKVNQDAIDTFIHAIFFGYKEFTNKKNLKPLELWAQCYKLSRVLFDTRGLLPSVLGRSLALKLKKREDDQIAQGKSENIVSYAAILSAAFMARRIANLVYTLEEASMSIQTRSFKDWSRGRTLYYVSSEITSKSGVARQGVYTLITLPDEKTQKPRLFLRDFSIDSIAILESLRRHTQAFREQAQGDLTVFLLLLLSRCKPVIPLLDPTSRKQLQELQDRLEAEITPKGQQILNQTAHAKGA